MRKFLVVAAVGALLLSIAAPALAIEFTFKGEYRVRFYDFANWGFDKNNDASTANGVKDPTSTPANGAILTNTASGNGGRGNPRGVQWRARPRFVVSDDNGNIQAVLRLEIGNTEFGGGGGDNTVGEGNAVPTGNAALPPSSNRVGAGAGGAIGADGMGVKTKWMYLDFAMPFGIPLRIRGGTQAIYLPKGMIVDDDAAGVTAYGEIKPFKYSAQWFRLTRAPSTSGANYMTFTQPTTNVQGSQVPVGSSAQGGVGAAAVNPGANVTKDSAYDAYIGKIDVAIAPWLNPGAYFMYTDNRQFCNGQMIQRGSEPPIPATCADRVKPGYFAGFTSTGKIAGLVDYDVDFVWAQVDGGPAGDFGQGSRGVYPWNNPVLTSGPNVGAVFGPGNPAGSLKVQGWALDAGIHMPVGPLTFNIVGSYATGDKQKPGQTHSDAFPWGIEPSWSGPSQTYSVIAPWEIIGEGGGIGGQEDVMNMNHGMTGLWTAGGYVTYNPVKALTLSAGYLHIGWTRKTADCAFVASGSTSCFGLLILGKETNPVAGNSSLGDEIDLKAIYQIWTGFSLRGSASWLIPKAGDTAAKYMMYMWYEF